MEQNSLFFLTLYLGNEDFTISIKELEETYSYIQVVDWRLDFTEGMRFRITRQKSETKHENKKKHSGRKLGATEIIIYGLKFKNLGVPHGYQSQLRFHFQAQTLSWLRKRNVLSFKPYNLNTGKDIDILELSIIDITLFSQMHLDLIMHGSFGKAH